MGKVAIYLLMTVGLFAQYSAPQNGATPGGSAGGDLSGTFPNPTVAAIGGKTATIPQAGGTLPVVCAVVSLAGQSASIGATNLLCNGAQAPAGQYLICAEWQTTSGQSGSGTIAATFAWSTAGVAVSNGGIIASGSLTAGTIIPGTVATQSGCKSLHHDGTSQITYATTYTSTGQYDLYIALLRFQ